MQGLSAGWHYGLLVLQAQYSAAAPGQGRAFENRHGLDGLSSLKLETCRYIRPHISNPQASASSKNRRN
jgi:hypothetical protein